MTTTYDAQMTEPPYVEELPDCDAVDLCCPEFRGWPGAAARLNCLTEQIAVITMDDDEQGALYEASPWGCECSCHVTTE